MSVAGIHTSLSPFHTELQWRQRARLRAASDLLGNVSGDGSLSSLEFVQCGVVEVRCSALCLAHNEALLLHSLLSHRVMDLLSAACGTSCTESA